MIVSMIPTMTTMMTFARQRSVAEEPGGDAAWSRSGELSTLGFSGCDYDYDWLSLVIIGYHWSLGFSDRDYYDVVLTVIIMMMNKRSVPHLQHHHYHHQEHLRIVMNSKDDQDDKTHGEQEGRACGELQAVLQREPHSLPRSQNWCGDDHFIYFHSWS